KLEMYGLSDPRLPFILYDYQKDLVKEVCESIETGQDVLIEKSRDMGITWVVLTVFFWYWLQPVGGNDFLVGSYKFDEVDKKGNIKTLFEKIRYQRDFLRPCFLPAGFNPNEHDKVGNIINNQTGSVIEGEHCTAEFSRSGRYKGIFMDEFAFWEENDEEAWTATTDSSPCRIVVSTPHGLGRKFADLRFNSGIKVITLHWSLHPMKAIGLYTDDTDKKRSIWYDRECERRRDDPQANIGQELDIDYLSSGSPYFDNVAIQNRYKRLCEDPPKAERFEFEISGNDVRLIPNDNGRIFIHEKCDAIKTYVKFRYCISADVAEGLEKGDYSVFYVYDRVQNKDVAWFHGRIDTDVLAVLLMHFSKLYDDAYIAPENNNHGHAVIQKLKSLNARMMFERDFTEYVDYDKVKVGWNTNNHTRPIMFAELRETIKQGADGILDVEFFNECLTFIYNKNGKPEAEEGNYDDRVIAQAIKLQLHKWLPAPKKAITEIRKNDYDYDYDYYYQPMPERPEGADGV
ncbi:MAG: hypothetical protein JXI43_12900, partial [Tissierellales bacterium]|nr:hypothetical protein [Tissierellales bacterium]